MQIHMLEIEGKEFIHETSGRKDLYLGIVNDE